MSFFLSWLQKKPEKKESSSITINVVGKKYPFKKDPVIRCGDICKHFQAEFANREKQGRAVDLRVMLVIESKKEKGQIISKRVLSPFERVFDEGFQEDTQKAVYKYYVVDMDEFPKTLSQYIGLIQQSTLQQNRDSKVEREGILQMRVNERHGSRSTSERDKKNGFDKKRFVLTQDDLIYCDKKDDSNLILLQKTSVASLCYVLKTYTSMISRRISMRTCGFSSIQLQKPTPSSAIVI